jgi:hypothetical protein
MGLERRLPKKSEHCGGRNIRIGRRMSPFEGEKTLLTRQTSIFVQPFDPQTVA